MFGLHGRSFRHVKIQLVRGAPDNRSNPKPTLHVSNNTRCSECGGVRDFRRTAWAGGIPGGWGSLGPLTRAAPQRHVTIQMTQWLFLFGCPPILLPHKKQCPPVGFKSLTPVYSTSLCLATPNLLWKATPWEKSMVAKINDLTMLRKKGFLKNRSGNCRMQPQLYLTNVVPWPNLQTLPVILTGIIIIIEPISVMESSDSQTH